MPAEQAYLAGLSLSVFLLGLQVQAAIIGPAARSKRDLAFTNTQPPANAAGHRTQPAPSIPAAYPGFEAAFQGECGETSNGPGSADEAASTGLAQNRTSAGPGNPCEHICLDLHDGTYECSCFYGFTLAVDGYSCSTLPASTASPVAVGQEAAPTGTLGAAKLESGAQPAVLDYRDAGSDLGPQSRVASGKLEQQQQQQRKSRRPIKAPAELRDDNMDDSKPKGAPVRDEVESARRLSYRLTDQDQLNSAAEIDLDLESESESGLDSDADVRSAMEQNDGLLRELSSSVAGWTYVVAPNQASRLDESKNGTSTNIKRAADYKLLAELVQETIKPDGMDPSGRFGISPASLPSAGLFANFRSSNPQLADVGQEIGFGAGGDLSSYQSADLVQIGSILLATDSTMAKTTTPKQQATWPGAPNNPLPCGLLDREQLTDTGSLPPLFTDCSQMPECESGGRCVVELLGAGSSRQVDSFGRSTIDGRHWPGNEEEIIGHQRAVESRPASPQASQIARCRCPVGRAGYLCQKPLQRTVPQFTGHSYLALPATSDLELDDLRLVFKPKAALLGHRELPALLVLQGQKFLLLLDNMNRIELRYFSRDNARQVIRVIGSRDAELNRWNELRITDASRDNNGLADRWTPGANRIVLVTPDKVQLFNESQQEIPSIGTSGRARNFNELFVAGRPEGSTQDGQETARETTDRWTSGDFRSSASKLGERSTVGFTGCIRDLSINGRAFNFRSDLNGDTLDGLDIGECCD